MHQAAFGARSAAEIEAIINMRPPASAAVGQNPTTDNLLQGGSIDEERIRQAMFGYSRNQRGEKVPLSVPLDNPRFSEDFVREAREIFAQGSSCPSCGCKLDSRGIPIPNR
jgi:hypothetical protein